MKSGLGQAFLVKDFSLQRRRIGLQVHRGDVGDCGQSAEQIGRRLQRRIPLPVGRLQTRQQVQTLPVHFRPQIAFRQPARHFFTLWKLFQPEVGLAQEQMTADREFVVHPALRRLLKHPLLLAE